MRIPLRLVFLALVLAEIAVFIQVGEAIGVAATLALTVLGMLAGIVLLRRQGMVTLSRLRADLAAGRPPARPLAEGAAATIGALLLILPGFISDVVGLLLFVPAVREALWRRVARPDRREVGAAGRSHAAARLGDRARRSEYGAAPRPDSPWRRGEGGQS